MRRNHDNQGPPERIGAIYERTRTPELKPAWDLLERLNPRPRERLLLAPAGDGALLGLICAFHRGGTVTAVDARPDRVAECRRAVEALAACESEVEIHHADAGRVVTPGGQDALLSHCHLPLCTDGAAFLEGLVRNLRPGGRFALQLPITGFCKVLEETVQETLEGNLELPAWEDLPHPADGRAVVRQIESMDLREAEHLEKIYLVRFDTAMEAVDTLFAGGGWPGLQELEAGRRDALAQELRIRLARRLGTIDNVELPFRRLLVWGRR